MIEVINLKNYKCFKNATDVRIAPLTLLCGVNSSGKSSILKSLLMLKQSYENQESSNTMTFNGKYVKCGRFGEISTQSNNEPITFKVSYELKKPTRFTSNRHPVRKESRHDITAFKNLNQVYRKFNADSFKVTTEITVEKSGSLIAIDDNILLEQKMQVAAMRSGVVICESSIHMKKLPKQTSQYAIRIKNIPDSDTEELIPDVLLRDAACYFENFNLVNVYSTDIEPKTQKVSVLLPGVYQIFRANALQFKNIHYLTPLRGYPQRSYLLDHETQDVGMSGEYTPYIIQKFKDKRVNGFFPPEDDKIKKVEGKVELDSSIQRWMEYLKLGHYTISKTDETVQLKVKRYNVSNVGFGVSQVLPIIVSGLTENDGETLLLEQPEIHLHPSAQMNMADFLLSMAVNGKCVVVETHSDHIINRIVRRIMEDPSLHDMVKIYFVDQDDEGCSKVQGITVDDVDGAVCDNPNFFFQFASETEKIIDVGYRNLQKRQGESINV
jgi:predicted ATPase